MEIKLSDDAEKVLMFMGWMHDKEMPKTHRGKDFIEWMFTDSPLDNRDLAQIINSFSMVAQFSTGPLIDARSIDGQTYTFNLENIFIRVMGFSRDRFVAATEELQNNGMIEKTIPMLPEHMN